MQHATLPQPTEVLLQLLYPFFLLLAALIFLRELSKWLLAKTARNAMLEIPGLCDRITIPKIP